ncbi:MAG: 1-deoxy-D-xylulose-5-phosphate synthase [Spirochaetales bacterium]|nr:1-deoxy-D-xylulose-5-phosphate synthase [Spirochaetales bacterium]
MNGRVKNLLTTPNRTFNAVELDALAAYFRTVIFDILHNRGTGHWGGAASVAEFPDRFFNVGVAEANMIDIAGAYGGLSDSFDGASHQAITDIAIMRALPNMQVIVPSDARQAEMALEYALKQDGPVYIRLNRNPMPDLPESDVLQTVRIVEGDDVTIAANGITASYATKAADLLAKDGIRAEVFSVPFVKPFASDALVESVAKTKRILTVEEHVLFGGFGSMISEHFMKAGIFCEFDSIGIEDTYTESGPYDTLLEKYGISAEAIADRARALIKKKTK